MWAVASAASMSRWGATSPRCSLPRKSATGASPSPSGSRSVCARTAPCRPSNSRPLSMAAPTVPGQGRDTRGGRFRTLFVYSFGPNLRRDSTPQRSVETVSVPVFSVVKVTVGVFCSTTESFHASWSHWQFFSDILFKIKILVYRFPVSG